MSGRVGNKIWRPLTGSGLEITHISAHIYDSNEIPTATPMFPESANRYRLLGMLYYILICRKAKMAAINRKWIGN